MNTLQLPNLLKGGWEHALILTYGLDALFFENALSAMLGSTCRNRIILADGQEYLRACSGFAENNLVRHLNQRYVAEGIFTPHAAHAKLILLTHPERGRLLVGSGNMSLQGYASGGELFCHYEWSPDESAALPAFQTAVELVRDLARRDLISEAARDHIEHLTEQTPWLDRFTTSDWRPVRHNLEQSFLSQFTAAIGDDPVEELTIMAPFYDEQAYTLRTMLEAISPQQVKIIVQPKRTYVDPAALDKVLSAFPGSIEILSVVELSGDGAYFHTKLYLAKTAARAVCLQGSPNLSRRAMLWTVEDGRGNIEVANLLTGTRSQFNAIFEPLTLTPVSLDEPDLDLSYQSGETDAENLPHEFYLLSGDLQEERLSLRFKGQLPALDKISLWIDEQQLSLLSVEPSGSLLIFQLSETAVGALGQTVPLQLHWERDGQPHQSNPIFVCNRANLNAELQTPIKDSKPERFGDLNLEDEELELLIGDLESHMVLDRRSFWQLANRQLPAESNNDGNDEALRLDYADIDYDKLRQHPKIRQYTEAASSNASARSRLQIILSSITDHFDGLEAAIKQGRTHPTTSPTQNSDTSEAESEAEREEEAETEEKRRQASNRRIRNIFRHFIRRYLRGFRSRDFQEIAGHEVIGHNYIIFSHLLWKLSQKDYFQDDPQFIIDAMVQTWAFFWGSAEKPGYFASLGSEQQEEVKQWMRKNYTAAYLLASLYWGEQMTHREKTLRLALRDTWRHLLNTQFIAITADVIEEAWIIVADLNRHEPPRPTRIFKSLAHLAEYRSGDEFKHFVEEKYGRGQYRIEPVNVHSQGAGKKIKTQCLILPASDALSSAREATILMQAWMQFDELPYYRVVSPNLSEVKRLAFYDVQAGEGLFFDRSTGEEVMLTHISAPRPEWNRRLTTLLNTANEVDEALIFDLPARQETAVQTESN